VGNLFNETPVLRAIQDSGRTLALGRITIKMDRSSQKNLAID